MKFSISPAVLLFVFLFSSFSFAQVNSSSGITFVETATFYQNSNDLSNIKGSPYVDEIFSPANISPLEKTFLVRYNAVIDEIEVNVENGKILALDKAAKNYIITFKKENKKYVILSNNSYHS